MEQVSLDPAGRDDVLPAAGGVTNKQMALRGAICTSSFQ
jgi:hypothetical protein